MNPQVPYDWQGMREICRRLRSPEGCTWDREQTLETLTPYVQEEMHELLEAVAGKSEPNICEEMGDLLFLLVFMITIAEEEGRFRFEDIARGIITKMIRRHPHVFTDQPVDLDPAQANEQWEAIKREERQPPDPLSVGARGLPALVEAFRVQEKAASFGFDWSDAESVVEKLDEERRELGEAMGNSPDDTREEIGDLLFTMVNLARHRQADPEQTLRDATRKFRRRFAVMEKILERDGLTLRDSDLEAMERAWQQAKRHPDA